ncbi:hypothetical protein GCM10009828_083850 [Actinoplanes couchii]
MLQDLRGHRKRDPQHASTELTRQLSGPACNQIAIARLRDHDVPELICRDGFAPDTFAFFPEREE